MIDTRHIVCTLVATLFGFGGTAAQETFFFADTLDTSPLGERSSQLSTITIDGACDAQIVALPVGPGGDGVVPYDNVVAIAVPSAGDTLIFFDTANPFADLIRVDLVDGTVSAPIPVTADIGPPGGLLGTIEQAAYSPDDVLYVTSSGQDRLYTVDTTTAMATSVGEVIWDADGTTVVDVQGADIAFASDGTLYLYTNLSLVPQTDAPKGLYRLTLPQADEQVVLATFLGAGDLGVVTGMAVRDMGLGDIVVADEVTNELIVLDRDTGAELERYAMVDEDCAPFPHVFGDMNNALLAPAECFLVIGDQPGTASFVEVAHLFETQVGPVVEETYPVLLDMIPEFVLPVASMQGALAGGAGATIGSEAVSPRWMRDGEFSVQVVMWNPTAFPSMPEQYSAGLYVRVAAGGSVIAVPYGTDQGGLEIWHEVFTNDDGQTAVRFPFSIPGM